MEKHKWTSSVFDSIKGKQPAIPSEGFEKRLLQSLEANRMIPYHNIINMKWLAVAVCTIGILFSVNFFVVENWKTKNEYQILNSNTLKNSTAENLIPNYDFLNESL